MKDVELEGTRAVLGEVEKMIDELGFGYGTTESQLELDPIEQGIEKGLESGGWMGAILGGLIGSGAWDISEEEAAKLDEIAAQVTYLSSANL